MGMTATERLRALLDECGVEWRAWDGVHPITVWHDERFSYEYMERTLLDGVKPFTGEVVDGSGRLEAVIHVCTPEQAIAATLGAVTCHVVEYEDTGIPVCSECGAVQPDDATVYYCWSCGRKVVDE